MGGALSAGGHRIGRHIGGHQQTAQQFVMAQLVAEIVLQNRQAGRNQRRGKGGAPFLGIVPIDDGLAVFVEDGSGLVVVYVDGIGDSHAVAGGGDAPFGGDAAAVGKIGDGVVVVAHRRHHRHPMAAQLLDIGRQAGDDGGRCGIEAVVGFDDLALLVAALAGSGAVDRARRAQGGVVVGGRAHQQGSLARRPVALGRHPDEVGQGAAQAGFLVVLAQPRIAEAHVHDVDAVRVGQHLFQGTGVGQAFRAQLFERDGRVFIGADTAQKKREHLHAGPPGGAVKVEPGEIGRRTAGGAARVVALGGDDAGDRRAVDEGVEAPRLAAGQRDAAQQGAVELPVAQVDVGVDDGDVDARARRHEAPFPFLDAGIGPGRPHGGQAVTAEGIGGAAHRIAFKDGILGVFGVVREGGHERRHRGCRGRRRSRHLPRVGRHPPGGGHRAPSTSAAAGGERGGQHRRRQRAHAAAGATAATGTGKATQPHVHFLPTTGSSEGKH